MKTIKLTAITIAMLSSLSANSAVLKDPTAEKKIGTVGAFNTEKRCEFSNISVGEMAYDGVGNWIVTKAGTIDVEAKGQKEVSISKAGTLIEKDTNKVVDDAIKYVYNVAKNATVEHADDIVGVASKLTEDFPVGLLFKDGVILASGKQDAYDLVSVFTLQFELGGYATVDKSKVKEGVDYLIQHDVECVQ